MDTDTNMSKKKKRDNNSIKDGMQMDGTIGMKPFMDGVNPFNKDTPPTALTKVTGAGHPDDVPYDRLAEAAGELSRLPISMGEIVGSVDTRIRGNAPITRPAIFDEIENLKAAIVKKDKVLKSIAEILSASNDKMLRQLVTRINEALK
jgi:hypothetical protein